ncbi:MAG TPA: glycosyltransferase family 2 protein, partial [Rhodospirillales bacterium]|nr:glycosyltransferase family 2 protein [Rhodospirillales bacterium]
MLFSEAKSSVYKYEPVINQKFEKDKPIFSIFICCYYNLDYIRQSIKSVLDQDYTNIELILVDNGAHLDVREYLREFYKNSTNTALVTFEVNQFEWSDTGKGIATCWNVALLHAKGDYISYLGYDDLFSSSYASRMVNLFLENPACVTAAPMPYSINSLGEVDKQSGLRDLNTRDRYTDGMDIAIDLIEGGPKKLFGAPGEIFAIRRDILLKYGGYDRISDISQVLKYAILGVSGFDSEAAVYWRHHDKQLNRQSKSKGAIFYKTSKKG